MDMPRDWNWRDTGGYFGSVIRLPGYTIRKNAKTGFFYVTCDRTGKTVSSGHRTPDDAERVNADLKPRPLS